MFSTNVIMTFLLKHMAFYKSMIYCFYLAFGNASIMLLINYYSFVFYIINDEACVSDAIKWRPKNASLGKITQVNMHAHTYVSPIYENIPHLLCYECELIITITILYNRQQMIVKE